MENKSPGIEVTFLSVDKQTGEVEAENAAGEVGVFTVVAPAKIEFCRPGPAYVGFNRENPSEINYARMAQSAQKPKQSFTKQSSFAPRQPTRNTSTAAPSPANEYVAEEREPKRIGVVREAIGITLAEFRMIYNEMAIKQSKWITASNLFPRGDGKYDAMFFIAEKTNLLIADDYLMPPKELRDEMRESIKQGTAPTRANPPTGSSTIKSQDMGTW